MTIETPQSVEGLQQELSKLSVHYNRVTSELATERVNAARNGEALSRVTAGYDRVVRELAAQHDQFEP